MTAVLNIRELASLLSLLDEDKWLEVISAQFQRTFVKGDHFKICSGLSLLLNQKLITTTTNRLVAYYILYDLYRTEPLASNPFLLILIETIQQGDIEPVEKSFLLHLLVTPPKELSKKTPKELFTYYDRNFQIIPPDLNSLKKLYMERQPMKSTNHSYGLFPTLYDANDTDQLLNFKEESSAKEDPILKLETEPEYVEDVLEYHSFEPQLLIPVPPLYEPKEEEDVIWIFPGDDSTSKVIWDYSMCTESDKGGEIRELMTKAFKGPLLPDQQKQVIKKLDQNPKLVYHCRLTPKKLPDLVENNPLIAIECLLKLMSNSQITEYFSVLVNMEMSLHSMEVVNRLTTAVELPTEFIHLYISNCIQSCVNTKDKYMQTRLVRLVCIFLQSLIRNKIINVKEILLEVQGFCVDFSSTKEAAGLFRLLKTLE